MKKELFMKQNILISFAVIGIVMAIESPPIQGT